MIDTPPNNSPAKDNTKSEKTDKLVDDVNTDAQNTLSNDKLSDEEIENDNIPLPSIEHSDLDEIIMKDTDETIKEVAIKIFLSNEGDLHNKSANSDALDKEMAALCCGE